jgi:hypothetical protein
MGYMDKQLSSQGRGVRPQSGVRPSSRVRTELGLGKGWGRLGSGIRPWSRQAIVGGGGSSCFGIAHACRTDACNALRRYLERPLTLIS